MLGQGTFGMGRGLTRVPARRQNRTGLRDVHKGQRCLELSLGKGGWPEGEAEEVGPRVRNSGARTQRCTSPVTSRRVALVRAEGVGGRA